MLNDLAEFAAAPERVFRAGPGGLIPESRVPEHAFYVGPYRGTFSWAEFPDGQIYRALTVSGQEGPPAPMAVASIAEELGFTGARVEDGVALPGRDWSVNVSDGEPPFVVVLQPALRTFLN